MSSMPPPPPPPPPPPMGAGGAPSGGVTVGEALNYGWAKFKQYAGPLIVILLVVVAVQLVFGLLARTVDSVAGQIVFQLLSFVVGQVVAFGIVRASLMVTEGVTPEVGKVFSGPYLGNYIVASVLFGLAVSVGFILCVLPGLALMVLLGFYGYFVIDKGQGPTEALSSSFNLVKANLGTVLGLLVVAFLLQLVGMLLCGIGLLVTGPVAFVMLAFGYKRLTGQPVAP